MIATNLLLSIGFSIITNFTSLVPVPEGCIPKSTNDFKRCLVGVMPNRPTDFQMELVGGIRFFIMDGSVASFDSQQSLFGEQNPDRLGAYTGTSILSSNQALLIASNTLQRLIKDTNASLANATPQVKQGGGYYGAPLLPFFWIEWPVFSEGAHGAKVEIDGRTGKVVALNLSDRAFFDSAFAVDIMKRVYTPEPRKLRSYEISPLRRFPHVPQPDTNYAQLAINNWLVFCRKLGCDPGGQTNVADIDWDWTWLCTNAWISTSAPVCQIRFKNGAIFESLQGVTISHFCTDACYGGRPELQPPELWANFRGKVLKDGHFLAKALEPVLVGKLGIPKDLLAPYRAEAQFNNPKIGTVDVKRTVMEWRNWPADRSRTVWLKDTKMALSAEFDLEMGDLKWISFEYDDPRFIQALTRAEVRPP